MMLSRRILPVHLAITAILALAAPGGGQAAKRYCLSQTARSAMHKQMLLPVLKSEIEAFLLNEFPGLNKINELTPILKGMEVRPQKTGIFDIHIFHAFGTSTDAMFNTAVNVTESGEVELMEPPFPTRFGKGNGPLRGPLSRLDEFFERALAFVAPNEEVAGRILSEGPDAITKVIWNGIVDRHPHWDGLVSHAVLGSTRMLDSFGTEKVYLSTRGVDNDHVTVKTTFDSKGTPTSTFLQYDRFEERMEHLLESKMEHWAGLSATIRRKLIEHFPQFDFDFSTISTELLESFKDGTASPGQRKFWISAKNNQRTQKLGVEVNLASPPKAKAAEAQATGESFIATVTSEAEITDLF